MYLNETYSKMCICKPLCDAFPIHNGLKQGDSLSLSLLNFDLEMPSERSKEIE
jgi:hypothetical protein